jgi:ABC-type Fe3+-hydroxamate transport system substrate-binding protein
MNSPIRQSANPLIVVDQIGKKIAVPRQPLRIVSVVPSQTELLHTLGLEEEVVGITRFCVHPDAWQRTKQRVGGTKKLNIELIRSLRPNLVIANKEENTLKDVQAIATFCPVWTSNVDTFSSALDMIHRIGELTNTSEIAAQLVHGISTGFSSLLFKPTYRCAYLIWRNPWMAAGTKTFIHEMLKACGMFNIMEGQERYPTIEIRDLIEKDIQILLLSSEPYPFKVKDLEELSNILPEVKLMLVDGEMFSWYGSRMLHFPSYFKMIREKIDGSN